MEHEHDYQPIPSQPPGEGLSLQAVFADAVLASKKALDAGHAVLATQFLKEAKNLPEIRQLASLYVAEGTGYAMLAQALQHGAPGQRF